MSTNEKQYVEKVLNKYTEKKSTKLEELRELDKKASKPATLFSAIFGTIGSLVLGFGMCVAMQVILPGLMWLGILVGVIGIFMVSVNYFIYKKLLEKGKKEYANRIIELSNELLKEE